MKAFVRRCSTSTRSAHRILFTTALLAACTTAVLAQSALPNAPGFMLASTSADPAAPPAASGAPAMSTTATMPAASRLQGIIQPGQAAVSLTAGDKFEYGFKSAFAPLSVAGWVVSAGYSQITNGSPNYGTDRGAFGQRLGAAAIRDSSETIIADSFMDPLFHEDPRYYRLGPSHGFSARLLYSITRPLLTRTDSGTITPNLANLTGTLAGDALSNLYYPKINRSATQTFETFGGSIGADALVNFLQEFTHDVTSKFHSHAN